MSEPIGSTSSVITTRIGVAKATGRFITTLTSRPQKPCSTSSRVLVFWVFSANQSMIFRENGQFARNGTFSSVVTPSASTRGPRMASTAGSTVIDRNAASMTEAMIA